MVFALLGGLSLPAAANDSTTNGMAWIPAGTFWMGSTHGRTDEQPAHQVTLDGFWMDKTPVSNEEFARFVKATGYITVAERKPDPKDFPTTVPSEMLVPGAVVFSPPSLKEVNDGRSAAGLSPLAEIPLDNAAAWWKYIPGANWRHPQGPSSDLKGLAKHPVVQVCWDDATAYAKWAGKRLPTEAEFEYAARGGLDRQPFVWGAEMVPHGKWMANIWQGRFPTENKKSDGFAGTSPVASFPPNGYGLYDMAGNVWEWCADWYRPDYYEHSPGKSPPGPKDSFDPDEPGLAKRVLRGGSFLCNDVYCSGYRPDARMKSSPDTALSHTGFRCVRSSTAATSR
ncbi:MAG TPA: formylglycine-generating enzyme family protein [Candidatus Saccharimonadales bacterium]|nr:formylglycine-generating enzyme family protein [Candidatus Saccharimonadales bacterium]